MNTRVLLGRIEFSRHVRCDRRQREKIVEPTGFFCVEVSVVIVDAVRMFFGEAGHGCNGHGLMRGKRIGLYSLCDGRT